MRHFYMILILFMAVPNVAMAQHVDLEEGLTQAILDMTTTQQRHLWWTPCGEHFRGRDPEAAAYANHIATTVMQEAGTDLDPWWMVAQLMQESGMNPCVFSNREFSEYASSLGRRPSERDVLRLLNSPSLREQHGIRAMDAGIAQFRWPGAARQLGVDNPAELLDVGVSVRVFATALRRYRGHCDEVPVFRGVDIRDRADGRIQTVRWSYPCAQTFWAIHNSGSPSSVRRQYIRSVQHWYAAGPAYWRMVVESGGGET